MRRLTVDRLVLVCVLQHALIHVMVVLVALINAPDVEHVLVRAIPHVRVNVEVVVLAQDVLKHVLVVMHYAVVSVPVVLEDAAPVVLEDAAPIVLVIAELDARDHQFLK